ncbi:MAG: sulfurtransferase complex subunit TusB [Gammaproteobacteria bacterium]
MLHIISLSPNQMRIFESYLRTASKEDVFLFINDGVYLIALCPDLPKQCYALNDDVQARGIKLPTKVKGININDFVDLTEQHECIQHWKLS